MWRVPCVRGRATNHRPSPPSHRINPRRRSPQRRQWRPDGRRNMTLADGWRIFVLLALTVYIVLDGYDLGIGVLTLFERDSARCRQMYTPVAWLWDGNESWLVL